MKYDGFQKQLHLNECMRDQWIRECWRGQKHVASILDDRLRRDSLGCELHIWLEVYAFFFRPPFGRRCPGLLAMPCFRCLSNNTMFLRFEILFWFIGVIICGMLAYPCIFDFRYKGFAHPATRMRLISGLRIKVWICFCIRRNRDEASTH